MKALSLISGGLDSLLATKLILEQGIEVEGINFFTGFTGDHDHCFKRFQNGCHGAKLICDRLGIKLHVVDVVNEFKSVIHNPRYGFGANLNPCLDCKLLMITRAVRLLKEQGFAFLISGEVLGQRPMSQRKDTLPLATKVTDDLIVRPLSAKLLPPTLPEREGWINRDLLCDFSGRGRQPQMDLARKFGFKEFPQPAGGCLLTDPNFSHRLRDLMDHRLNQDYSLADILLLRLGRHLRIKSSLKAIVGRDEVENDFIMKFSDQYILLQTINYPGALMLLDGSVDENELLFMARLAAYFSKGRGENRVKVLVKAFQKDELVLEVASLRIEDILSTWYV